MGNRIQMGSNRMQTTGQNSGKMGRHSMMHFHVFHNFEQILEFMTGKNIWILPAFFSVILVACEDGTVETAPEVVIDYVVTDASGFNAEDGSIDVTLAGAPAPVAYFWSNGARTEDIGDLFAGDYTLKVTYGGNGISEVTIPVKQPQPPDLQLTFEVTDVSRYGKSDGSIILSVSGGIPPYQAIWNGKDTTMALEAIPAGIYEVEVMDSGLPSRILSGGSAIVVQPDFICGTDSIADVNGNLYSTVLIGNQCWLAENLRTSRVLVDTTLMEIEQLFCAGTACYDARGAHYSWKSAMNGEEAASGPYAAVQGICPEGFYLPTRKIFQDLDSMLSIDGIGGPGTFPGTKMKGEGSSSGFDALYNGNWGYGVYINSKIAVWWTSTEFASDPGESYYFMVTDDTPFLVSGHKPKEFGMSIRCIRLME
jgi:uncharacterized protein (TIGR02145 family)